MKFAEMIVLLGIFVVLPIIIVALVARAKTNATNKRAEIALAAIEKNSDVDLEQFFKKMTFSHRSNKERLLDRLLCGCIFTFFGAGIYVAIAMFGLVIEDVTADMFVGLSFVAVPSLGVGIAFLVNYFVGRRVLKQEIEAEAKNGWKSESRQARLDGRVVTD